MNYIAISFTLKGQNFEKDILPALKAIKKANNWPILIHGFMPKHIVEQKGFSTEVVDALNDLFPNQININRDGVPDRDIMTGLVKATRAKVYAIGALVEGVKDEVEGYQRNGIFVMYAQEYAPNAIDFVTLQGTTLSFGQQAVGLSFNPSGDRAVHICKEIHAEAIDQMNDLRSSTLSGDKKRYASTAITNAEIAQMLAVKAITWKD